jgi:iron complex transport system substrate-binding protein
MMASDRYAGQSVSRREFLVLAGTAGAAALAGMFVGKDDLKVASAESTQTQTVTDMGGTEVEVPVEPSKFADAWYAHNEIVIMLNNAEGLVATHCTPDFFPWMYRVCPNMYDAVSTFGDDFNYEELVSLAPQVVFDSSDSMRDKLSDLGIPLVNTLFLTFDDMQKSVSLTAQVLGGDAPEIADRYNAELSETLASITEITDKLSEEERPKVLHGDSVYSLKVDGPGTLIDVWISTCGGRIANSDMADGQADADVSLESIIGWNPDVIITAQPEEVDEILNDPDWASITAVKNGDVYVNPCGVFPWDRYGVEELLQVQWVANLLHPDLFPDLDIRQKVKDFYSTYLRYDLTDEEVELIMGAQNPPEDGAAAASSEADSAADGEDSTK